MFLQLLSFCSDENNSPSCDFPPEMFSNWLRSQEIGPFVFTANDDNDDDDDFGHDVDDGPGTPDVRTTSVDFFRYFHWNSIITISSLNA